MRNTLILAAIAALAFTSVADAKACKDKAGPGACRDKHGHFAKCASVAAIPAAPMAMKTTTSGKAKVCKKGKPCGNTCISIKDVCHK